MIAVIGDIMLDKYIYGSSTRMSPECLTAPVVKEYTTEVYVGGAGNTALNIKNLQSPVTLFCAINKNSELRNLIRNEDLSCHYVANYNNDVIKTRLYSNGQYLARLDYDYEIDCSEDELCDTLFTYNPDLIVFSDYDKGTILNPSKFIEKANSKNIPVLVDPKKNLDSYAGAFVLKPNFKEFCEWLEWDEIDYSDEGINCLTPSILSDAVQTLKVENLIVTLGSEGCILATKSGLIKRFEAFQVKAIDVTGAGDSFMAGLTVALHEGKSITKAIEFAIKIAGIAVTKKGTAYVKRNEI